MELCIQHLVRDPPLGQQLTQFLRCLNGNGTYQNRLSLAVCFLHRIHDRIQLFFPGLVYRILQVLSCNRLIGRYLYNIHSVNITEFLLLGKRCTCHTCLLFKFVKEILESNGCKRLTFSLNLNMFLGFNCLMKAVGIASSRHNTSGKLIDDQNLIILNHIILVTEHQIIGTQRKDNVMLYFNVFRVGKVFNLEELFHLVHALSSKINYLILLINDKVSGLLSFHTHDGIHLGKILHVLTTLHLLCKDIADLIKLG